METDKGPIPVSKPMPEAARVITWSIHGWRLIDRWADLSHRGRRWSGGKTMTTSTTMTWWLRLATLPARGGPNNRCLFESLQVVQRGTFIQTALTASISRSSPTSVQSISTISLVSLEWNKTNNCTFSLRTIKRVGSQKKPKPHSHATTPSYQCGVVKRQPGCLLRLQKKFAPCMSSRYNTFISVFASVSGCVTRLSLVQVVAEKNQTRESSESKYSIMMKRCAQILTSSSGDKTPCTIHRVPADTRLSTTCCSPHVAVSKFRITWRHKKKSKTSRTVRQCMGSAAFQNKNFICFTVQIYFGSQNSWEQHKLSIKRQMLVLRVWISFPFLNKEWQGTIYI